MCNDNAFGLTASAYAARGLGGTPPICMQNDYSIINRRIDENGLSEASSPVHENCGFMAYNALAGGVLTGKYLDMPAAVDSLNKADALKLLEKPRGRMDERGWGQTLYRYRSGPATEATRAYAQLAKANGLSLAELSLRWTSGNQSLRTAYVDNRIRGYIASGPLPTNVPSTRIDGLVASWEGRWTSLVAGASYEHLDPRNTTPGANYDKQLIRRSKDAFRAQADWLLGEYSVGGTVSAFSGRYEDSANTLRTGGFTTLDLRADWRYDRAWTVGLRMNNLTGKVYETAYGFNQPGREIFVTLRWNPPAK
jgi:hypothetical protein